MDTVRWERVKHLFGAAQQVPETERASWLAAECGDDSALQREVEQLLDAAAQAGSFLETSSPLTEPSLVGREVGGWRLEAEIGRGGMGIVYRAVREHEGFRQEAALKLLRGGRFAVGVVPRFEQERRILARLRHPAIASLLDGGTSAEGEPWLAMEYVEGRPLHTHCAVGELGVRDRLELFREVCEAVAYAHRNLVVHRDLKPTNILVSADGRVKLLDFGIARLLAPPDESDPETAVTATMLPALTPEYASPEQVRGEPVTTASDVYSLGVLLFELLTGERPYRVGRAPDEIVRAVCETQPPRPSTIVGRRFAGPEAPTRPAGAPAGVSAAQLAGDLDTIVLKALRKEPERRYASVAELDEDVRRHLAGLPVRARPDTFAYRTGKLVARHRAASVVAVFAALSVVVGVAATLREARIAEWNRARAERRFAETRKLANTLLFDIHDDVARLPGSMKVRQRLVVSAVEYLEGLSRDAEGDWGLQLELAAAWRQLGMIQGGLFNENLGQREDAERSLARARELAEAAAAAAPQNAVVWRRLGDLYLGLGPLRMTQGDMAGALAELDRAAASYDAGLRLAPHDSELRRSRAAALAERAFALALNDRIPEGLEESRRSVSEFEALLSERPGDPELREMLATALQRHGQFEEEMAPRRRAGLPAFQRSLELSEALLAESPGSSSLIQGVLAPLSSISESLEAAGELAGALEASARALPLAERLAAVDPDNVVARSDLAYLLVRRAGLQTRTGLEHEALAVLARARQLLEPLLAADPGHAQLRFRIAELTLAEGRAWAALAVRGPAGERSQARQRALARLREASVLWKQLDTDGLVVGQDRETLATLDDELAALKRPAASR